MFEAFLNQLPNLVQSISLIGNNIEDKSTSGNVVSFNYQYYNNDPYPVIITTGFFPNTQRIGGLNLHYLTPPLFRALLNQWAGNSSFNYYIIKNQPIIRQAFRTYKISGIKNPKSINWRAILNSISMIRNYSPQDIQVIQNQVDQQMLSRNAESLNNIFGNIVQKSFPLDVEENIPDNYPN